MQLRIIQGQTAGALEKLGVQFVGQYGLELPKFATGTNYVPQDMAAIIHKGEAIIPAAYNPANGGGTSADVVRAIERLQTQLDELRGLQEKGNEFSAATAKTLNIVTRGGRAIQTEAFV